MNKNNNITNNIIVVVFVISLIIHNITIIINIITLITNISTHEFAFRFTLCKKYLQICLRLP